MSTIAERIQFLLDERNEKAAPVFDSLSLSKNALSEWKRGKANPSSDAILKLAQYFGVSTDYLLTGYDYKNKLSEDEIRFLQTYSSLSDENKKICLKIIKGLNALDKI